MPLLDARRLYPFSRVSDAQALSAQAPHLRNQSDVTKTFVAELLYLKKKITYF